eukprot:6197201-Pleurochrysis_carterae.AAC.1
MALPFNCRYSAPRNTTEVSEAASLRLRVVPAMTLPFMHLATFTSRRTSPSTASPTAATMRRGVPPARLQFIVTGRRGRRAELDTVMQEDVPSPSCSVSSY